MSLSWRSLNVGVAVVARIGVLLRWAIAIAAFCATPARADYLVPWVAANCDPAHGRGLVRFGYADSENSAYFRGLPKEWLHGLASQGPAHASTEESSCSYKPGSEIKVRIGDGYGGVRTPYSVWVAGIRVEHGIADDADAVPLAVLVDARGVRRCRLNTSGPGAFPDDPDSAAHLPIVCDALRPLAGNRDPPPRAGTVQLVDGRDLEMCKRLMSGPHPPSLSAIANVLPYEAWTDLGQVEGIALSRLDTDEHRGLSPVYKISSGGAWTYLGDRAFAILVPKGTTQAMLNEFASEVGKHDWSEVPQRAQARGWQAIASDDLGFPSEDSSFDIGTQGDAFLILVSDTNPSEKYGGRSALLRVSPGGPSELLCRFNEVQKHL
jgi:hypothetical protein